LNPLTAEQKKIVEENQRLVWYFYHKMKHKLNHTFYDREDYFQIGMLGLVKAVRKWDPMKAKFATYAGVSVINEFRISQRIVKDKLSPMVTGLTFLEMVFKLGTTDEDMVEQYAIDRERVKLAKDAIEKYLTEREKRAVYGYLSQKKQRELAEELNTTQSNVSRMQRKIFKRIRQKIG